MREIESLLHYILDTFRAGRMVKLTPAQHRATVESIEGRLTGWWPVMQAAATYYDNKTSGLPADDTALLEAIRKSGLV